MNILYSDLFMGIFFSVVIFTVFGTMVWATSQMGKEHKENH